MSGVERCTYDCMKIIRGDIKYNYNGNVWKDTRTTSGKKNERRPLVAVIPTTSEQLKQTTLPQMQQPSLSLFFRMSSPYKYSGGCSIPSNLAITIWCGYVQDSASYIELTVAEDYTFVGINDHLTLGSCLHFNIVHADILQIDTKSQMHKWLLNESKNNLYNTPLNFQTRKTFFHFHTLSTQHFEHIIGIHFYVHISSSWGVAMM